MMKHESSGFEQNMSSPTIPLFIVLSTHWNTTPVTLISLQTLNIQTTPFHESLSSNELSEKVSEHLNESTQHNLNIVIITFILQGNAMVLSCFLGKIQIPP